jgi:hypothetical protein
MFSQPISVGSNRGSVTVLPVRGSGNHAVAVSWRLAGREDRYGSMPAVPTSRQRFWEMYGRFRNVRSKRQRHSSQNVQTQHPPHKEERDHGHDNITYPLTRCFRFGPVCHERSVAVLKASRRRGKQHRRRLIRC